MFFFSYFCLCMVTVVGRLSRIDVMILLRQYFFIVYIESVSLLVAVVVVAVVATAQPSHPGAPKV